MRLSVDLHSLGLTQQDLGELCWIIGVCHDYGKASRFFQHYLLETDEKIKASLKNRPETNHAHLSSLFTYSVLKKRFSDSGSNIASLIPIIGYEVVRRHHGNLGDMQKEVLGRGEVENNRELDTFKKQIEAINLDDLSELYKGIFTREEIDSFNLDIDKIYNEIRSGRRVLRRTREHGLYASILTLFCFSVLISMDKEDASRLVIERKPEELQPDIVEKYRKIMGYDVPDTELNRIRDKIYLDAESKIDKINLDQRILSLNMPTGSGKTLTGLNFALKLRDRLKNEKGVDPRIIYCVSFISIIDQNSMVFENAYKAVLGETPANSTMLKHHHLADVLYDQGEDEYEYDVLESQFFVEGWNSEIIFTTFMQFFHSILTNRNRALRKLHRIANSIVLLDEVQSIPYAYWPLLGEYLKVFSELFHTYFIFMTATMPYIIPKGEITEIIDDPEQYYDFFDRVDLFPELEARSIEAYMINVAKMIRVSPQKRYLLIHNTVKSSQQVYRYLKENVPDVRLVYLSTMVTPKERLRRIDSIKKDSAPVVVVSTQLVEAGVDIDMDIVFRDMAPLDSVIQASGRCNRNFRAHRGKVYLVKLVDKKPFFSYIYGVASILVTRTLSLLTERCFPEHSFRRLVNRFYGLVYKGMSHDSSREIIGCLEKMEFKGLSSFKLIANEYPKVDVFIEDDEEAVDIWNRYKELKEIRDWKERHLGYLKLKREFLEHVISVPEIYRNKVGWSESMDIGYVSFDEELYDVELGFIRDESVGSTTFL